jgi:CHRD domain-containing protein
MKNRGIALVAVAAAVVAIAAACGGSDDPTGPTVNDKLVTFTATMNFAGEVPTPTVASTGTGTFTATLDTSTNIFTWDLTFTGLTSGVNNGHIHGPATTTQAAGTTINFNTAPGATFSFGQTSGTGHGVMVLSAATAVTSTINGDSLKKLLFAGLTYANIHTTSNPGGEIRGQITKQ